MLSVSMNLLFHLNHKYICLLKKNITLTLIFGSNIYMMQVPFELKGETIEGRKLFTEIRYLIIFLVIVFM